MFKQFAWKCVPLAALALATAGAQAQAPEQTPIKLVVGFAPGNNGDLILRILAEELRPLLGRNVVVENKPGAGGRLAAQALKTGTDTSTYLMAPDSWSIFPTLLYTEEQLRYNIHKDFVPVARVASFPLGLFTSDKSGINSIQDLVAQAKKDPNQGMYGSSGSGSITEFLGIVMSKEFGAKMTVVPFKGGSEVKTNLMGGQVPVAVMTAGDGVGDSGGRIKPLGLLVEKRWALAPDVPTLKEQGYNVTQGGAFSGLWASVKTPEAERLKLESALKVALAKPEVQERMAKIYAQADFAEGAVMRKQVDDLLAYWGPIVKASGFKPQ